MFSTSAPEALSRRRRSKSATKRVQIVMNRSGDTRFEFDAADAASVAAAERRFYELTGSGFRAAALSGDGTPGTLLGSFDPNVEQTLFIPQLQGG